MKGPVGTFAANAPVFYEDEPDDEESDDEDGAPVSVPSAPDTVKFIETEVFGGAVRAYIEDVIEVNLPEWSGRMDRAYALAELARLKAFVVQVEQAVSGALGTDTPPVEQSVPPQRDTDNVPSERAQVVEDAVREDEAADDDKSLSELHDEYVRHWDDWKDSGDYGYGPEDNPFQSWLKINYPKAYRRSMVIDQRRIMRFRREIARERGARPYTVVFELAHGVRFFDGEVYRVISPADFSSDDIPF